jgi:uncharacterized protein (DUF2062 family)
MAKRKKNKLFRYFEYKILHIDDTPHKISLGVAIGLFMAYSPLLGLHLLQIIILSILLRANKFAALVSTWVSNVFTYAIIYYPAYLIGKIICNFFPNYSALSDQQVSSLFNKLFAPSNMLTGFYTKEYWRQFWMLLKQIGPELWIGCLILGSIAAVASYFICYYLIKSHRAKNPHRRYRKY